jgi:hypothetical protein
MVPRPVDLDALPPSDSDVATTAELELEELFSTGAAIIRLATHFASFLQDWNVVLPIVLQVAFC